MIWQDLLLDRWMDEAELRVAAAVAFLVPVATVAITDDAEQLAGISPSVRVILERTRQHRDFPSRCSSPSVMTSLRSSSTDLTVALLVARELAGHLDATVLFAEGPLTPSEWVRVRPTGL